MAKGKPTVAFINEHVTCCFRLSHYPPPHSHRSHFLLPASVIQFLCLPLTAFPVLSSLYATPPTNQQRFLECTLPVEI